MRTNILTSVALACTLAMLPAVALASLEVDTNGFARVVTEATQGDSCHVHGPPGAKTVRCPDGSSGTMTLYRNFGESPVCELDFWYAGNGSGAQRWHAHVSHPNGTYGTCMLHWKSSNALQLNLQPQ